MELLLDPGAGGTLRGLRDEEPDVGAVHLPEGVTPPAAEQTPEQHAALLLLRRRLAARMILPPRGFTGPR